MHISQIAKDSKDLEKSAKVRIEHSYIDLENDGGQAWLVVQMLILSLQVKKICINRYEVRRSKHERLLVKR